MERINVSQCAYRGKRIILQEEEGRGIWKLEFTSKKVSEEIRYVRCVNYIYRRVIVLMFVHLSGMQYARLCDQK